MPRLQNQFRTNLHLWSALTQKPARAPARLESPRNDPAINPWIMHTSCLVGDGEHPGPDRTQKKKNNTHLAGNNILPITLVPFFRLNGNFPARLHSRLLLSYAGNSRLISTFDLNLSGRDILRCVRFSLSFLLG